jgi:hypothetical protein
MKEMSFEEIRKYFTTNAWHNMAEVEKRRFFSMDENYLDITSFGKLYFNTSQISVELCLFSHINLQLPIGRAKQIYSLQKRVLSSDGELERRVFVVVDLLLLQI